MQLLTTSIAALALIGAEAGLAQNVTLRVTPFGTQKLMPVSAPAKPDRGANAAQAAETPEQVVGRANDARDIQRVAARLRDSQSEGRITLFDSSGPKAAFGVTVLRKGDSQVQRIIRQPAGEVRQGSDGVRTWNSFAGFEPPAEGPALRFIESQTVRGAARLFEYQGRRASLRDAGQKGGNRVLEVEDEGGRKTRYFVEDRTSRVTRLEFESGESRDMFSGRAVPVREEFVYSEFRTVQGLLTPFRIEHFSNGSKVEEMVFTSVRYNASVRDDAFRP